MLSKKIKAVIISITMCMSLVFSGTVFAENNINVERLYGQNRYQTNSKIVDQGWEKSDNAILCNGTMYADALCSTPLSKKLKAPILLTDGIYYVNDAFQEMKRLEVTNVYIIGGVGVIPQGIEDNLKIRGYNVIRIAGQDRYETSLKVAEYVGNNTKEAFILDGNDWQDALTISPIASGEGYPIVLTEGDNQDKKIADYFEDSGTCRTFVGNKSFIDKKFSQLGIKRYIMGDTPIDVFKKAMTLYPDVLNFDKVFLASDSVFADALSGCALASLNNNPIVLVGGTNQDNVKSMVNENKSSISTINVLGGTGVISDVLVDNIADSTNTPSTQDPVSKFSLYCKDPNVIAKLQSFVSSIKNYVDSIDCEYGQDSTVRLTIIQKSNVQNIASSSISFSYDTVSKSLRLSALNISGFNTNVQNKIEDMVSVLSDNSMYNLLMYADFSVGLQQIINTLKEDKYEISSALYSRDTEIFGRKDYPTTFSSQYGSYGYGVLASGGELNELIYLETTIN